MRDITFSDIRLPLLGAMCMTLLGTYSLALAHHYQPDWIRLHIALIITGPLIFMSGVFARHLRPTSKLGWIVINYGFNFSCGLPLWFFHPLNPCFSSILSNGVILCFMFLFISANSWITLHQTYRAYREAQLWQRGPFAKHDAQKQSERHS